MLVVAVCSVVGCVGAVGGTSDGGSGGGGTSPGIGGGGGGGGGTGSGGGNGNGNGNGGSGSGSDGGGGGGGGGAAPLAISPPNATVNSRAQQAFFAWGGGGPFNWSLSTNQSGGSLSPVKDYVGLTAAPSLSGVTQWQQWAHAQPVVVMDNHGNHELFTFGSPGSSGGRLHLLKSADLGDTWAWASPDTYAQPVASDNNAGVMSVAQDSAGAVHLLYYRSGFLDVAYYRLTLTYSGGSISGYSGLTAPIAVPGLESGDSRGVIRSVTTAAGTEVLAVLLTGGGNRLRGAFCLTSTLAPAAAADFKDLSGKGNSATLVIDDPRAGGGSHDHTVLFAQLGASKDLWVFAGNTPAEASPTSPTTITRARLTASGQTWTLGAPADGSTSNAWLMGVVGTGNFVWAMVGQYDSGEVRFARVGSSGAYEDQLASIPSPVNDARSSQTMFGTFTVNPDETRIWAVFTRDPGNGGNWYDFTPTGAYWNGATWQTRGDSAHGDSASVSYSSGLGGSTGWDTGVVALMTKTVGSSFNGPILLATVRALPDGPDGGAGLSAEGLYTAGPTSGSTDRVTVTDHTGASASATVTVP